MKHTLLSYHYHTKFEGTNRDKKLANVEGWQSDIDMRFVTEIGFASRHLRSACTP
jgi:hypothetical protein